MEKKVYLGDDEYEYEYEICESSHSNQSTYILTEIQSSRDPTSLNVFDWGSGF